MSCSSSAARRSAGKTRRSGLQLESLRAIARQIAAIHRSKIQLAVVIGGGNIVRGKSLRDTGITPVAADTMGMIATVINGVALQDVLETSAWIRACRPRSRCRRSPSPTSGGAASGISKRDAWSSSPPAPAARISPPTRRAALRAREIGADVLLKATNVDGVYSADPKKHPDAKRFFRLTYDQVIHDKLQVMDATAITLCREGNVPIIVFNMSVPNNIRRAIAGRNVGTYIGEK